MIGSKRLSALETEIAVIRQMLEGEQARSGAVEVVAATLHERLDAASTRLDTVDETFAHLTARLEAVEARLGEHAGAAERLEHLSEMVAAEQARRTALDQVVAKLERRIEAQADEARVTATALLQRLDGALRARADAG